MAKHKKSRKMSWNELWLEESKKIPEVPEPETPIIAKSAQDPQSGAGTTFSATEDKIAMSAPN